MIRFTEPTIVLRNYKFRRAEERLVQNTLIPKTSEPSNFILWSKIKLETKVILSMPHPSQTLLLKAKYTIIILTRYDLHLLHDFFLKSL